MLKLSATAIAITIASTLLLAAESHPAQSTIPGYNGKIAFEHPVPDNNGIYDIFTVDPDGTNLTNISNSTDYQFDPAWSPEGSRIAFANTSPHNDALIGIWIMDADGSNKQQVTNGADFDPDWSPDGTRIAFGAQRDDTFGIYMVELDSLDVTFLTHNGSIALNGGPKWSPDGSQIAHGYRQIIVTNVDGSGEVEVTTDGGTGPIWSPDGTKIAYVYTDLAASVVDIHLINADGSDRVNLTDSAWSDGGGMAWSPDGGRIVYTVATENHEQQLWMMNADGSGQTRFTSLPSFALDPAWQTLPEDPGYPAFPLTGTTPFPLATPTPTPGGLPDTGGLRTANTDLPLALAAGVGAILIATASLWLAARRTGRP